MRTAQDNPGYVKLLDHYYYEKYQLRYTGGIITDVNQILVKGKGVFCNTVSPCAKSKLRVLYELIPIGYVIEKAGGRSSNCSCYVLYMTVSAYEDRSQVCYGSAEEVASFEDLVTPWKEYYWPNLPTMSMIPYRSATCSLRTRTRGTVFNLI